MAIAKLGFMTYLIMLLFTNMIVVTSAQCQGDFQGLVQECSKYVQKPGPQQSPSQGCCKVIKNVDLPCVCQHVTSQVEKIISMQKAAFVTASCGMPLAHGTKCGSKKLYNQSFFFWLLFFCVLIVCISEVIHCELFLIFAGYTVP